MRRWGLREREREREREKRLAHWFQISITSSRAQTHTGDVDLRGASEGNDKNSFPKYIEGEKNQITCYRPQLPVCFKSIFKQTLSVINPETRLRAAPDSVQRQPFKAKSMPSAKCHSPASKMDYKTINSFNKENRSTSVQKKARQ